MKYFRYWFDIGYRTGDDELLEEFPDNVTQAEIENYGSISFHEHCEDYEFLFMGDFDEDGEEDYETAYDNYIDNWCSWGYEEISKEEYEELLSESY